MNRSPFFTVIIPLYNKSDTIERALRSVFAQTFRDFEVIVVNDGSKDDSEHEVRKFLSAHNVGDVLVTIENQVNGGASAARNKGAILAKGEFVTFLDADDEWLEMHLGDMANVLKEYPTAQVVTTMVASVYNGKRQRPRIREKGIKPFCVYDYPFGGYPMCSDSIAIKRSLFLDVGGYDCNYHYYEDRELYYRLADKIGAFYANWRTSALYHHDALQSVNISRRHSYDEFAYLQATEKLMAAGSASARRVICVREIVHSIVRGHVVRCQWQDVSALRRAYPRIYGQIPMSGTFFLNPIGRILFFLRYSMDWIIFHVLRMHK